MHVIGKFMTDHYSIDCAFWQPLSRVRGQQCTSRRCEILNIVYHLFHFGDALDGTFMSVPLLAEELGDVALAAFQLGIDQDMEICFPAICFLDCS